MPDEIVIADSIADLSRDDWNVLTENDVYGQYGWLQTVETAVIDASDPKYVLIYRDGHPLAATVLYTHSRAGMSGRLDDLLFGRAAKVMKALRLTPARTLYCGPLIGQGRHIFWNKQCDPEQATICIRTILRVMQNQLAAAKVPIVFGRIPEDESELLRELRAFGCIESNTWPINYVDLEWDNFDDYVKSLSRLGKNMSTKARREISAPEKEGIRIESLDNFTSDATDIDDLFLQNQRKHATATPVFKNRFSSVLNENNLNQSIMNIARTDDGKQLQGCALLLTAGTCAAGPLIGIEDNTANRKAFTYFNLSVYAPIRFCLENRISRIYFGSGLTRMKQKRGCKQMSVYVFALPGHTLSRPIWRCWMWLHRNWISSKARREQS